MDFGREDYNKHIIDTSNTIPEDEPVFLIRGIDKVGFEALRSYAHFLRLNGGSDTVYDSVLKQAAKMEAWHGENGKEGKKLPTLPIPESKESHE